MGPAACASTESSLSQISLWYLCYTRKDVKAIDFTSKSKMVISNVQYKPRRQIKVPGWIISKWSDNDTLEPRLQTTKFIKNTSTQTSTALQVLLLESRMGSQYKSLSIHSSGVGRNFFKGLPWYKNSARGARAQKIFEATPL